MFQLIILLSALFIATCAAFFSIFGISQLFIGALVSARVMALSLEIGKLVVVSFVYRYWKRVGWWLKIYMLLGAIVLSGITSAGIYGYLSAAYAVSAVDFSNKEARVNVMTTLQDSKNSQITANESRIREMETYRSGQEARLNQLVGDSTGPRVGFLTQQSIVRQAETDIRNLRNENARLIVERDSLESAKAQVMQEALTTNSKVGTFWYVARALGVPLDKIVKWFILAIVSVFDPLAVALIIAYNFMVREGLGRKKKVIVEGEEAVVDDEGWLSPRLSMLKWRKKPKKTDPELEQPTKAMGYTGTEGAPSPKDGRQSILGIKF